MLSGFGFLKLTVHPMLTPSFFCIGTSGDICLGKPSDLSMTFCLSHFSSCFSTSSRMVGLSGLGFSYDKFGFSFKTILCFIPLIFPTRIDSEEESRIRQCFSINSSTFSRFFWVSRILLSSNLNAAQMKLFFLF